MATGYDPVNDLTCPICRELFKTPKILPCGHTICMDPCLRQLTANSGNSRMRCPECRTEHTIPIGGVSNFPTNFLINRLLERQEEFHKLKTKGPEKVTCPQCSSNTYVFNCLHCGSEICEKCRTKHTTEMLGKTKFALNNLGSKIKEKQTLEPAVEMKKKLESDIEHMIQSMDVTMNNLIGCVEERRQQLKDQALAYAEAERLAIDNRQVRFRAKLTETSKFCEEANMGLTGNPNPNQTEMFQLQCQIGRHKRHGSMLQSDAKLSTIANMNLNEDTMKQAISSFGQLEVKERVRVEMNENDEFIPDHLRPRRPYPKVTYENDAEVLLFGLRRKKGKKNDGKR